MYALVLPRLGKDEVDDLKNFFIFTNQNKKMVLGK